MSEELWLYRFLNALPTVSELSGAERRYLVSSAA